MTPKHAQPDVLAQMSILPALASQRVDSALATLLPRFSRACWQHWLQSGEVRVNGARVKNNYKLVGGELVVVAAQLPEHLQSARVEDAELSTVYEDEHLLVIDKAAGMPMHPGAGIYSGTVLNALLGRGAPFDKLPRAGIVHRLDKDTTGLVAIAKSLPAIRALSQQLASRSMRRNYYAICENVPVAGAQVDKPMARNSRNRLKMQCFEADQAPPKAKPARTNFRVVEKFTGQAWLQVALASGRTHQIRVHLSSLGFPLVGDRLYGWRRQIGANMSAEQRRIYQAFPRQALHAHQLELLHPDTGTEQSFSSPMPEDMGNLLELLRGRL